MTRSVAQLMCAVALSCCSAVPETSRAPGSDQGVDADSNVDSAAADLAADTNSDLAFDPLRYVDPFIGTGGRGFAYAGMTPAVQTPLGMVKVGPDSTAGGVHPSDFHHFSGYWFEDADVRGFSHTHLIGTGASDYGNLRTMVVTDAALESRTPGTWFDEKDPDAETAAPGYFATRLVESDVRVELTATPHAAVHRYTPADAGPRWLTVDAAASLDGKGTIDAEITTQGTQISGWVTYAGNFIGRASPFTLHFAGVLSAAPNRVRAWDEQGLSPTDLATARGTLAGVALGYDSSAPVELRMAVSFVDARQARENLKEVLELSFDEVRATNEEAWRDRLSRIRVGGSAEQRTVFYTALYNTYRMPTRFDEGGRYLGFDGQIHDIDHAYYTDLSLWDTYRTLHPWWTLFEPELARDVLRSLLRMKRDGGWIPRWPAAAGYTNAMEGDSAALLFAEGISKGIGGVDYDAAFDALWQTATAPVPDGEPYAGRDGVREWVELGWVPADQFSGGASNTLEYAVDDAALAVLAGALERPEAAVLKARAQQYRNIWDPETRFFRPRNADGTFVEPFERNRFHDRGGDFTEGSARHWRYYVPHDPAGLIELFGGPELFVADLENFMQNSRLFGGDLSVLAIPDPYYWHTNQPPLHAPFLFSAAGELGSLGRWVRAIQESAYTTGVDGLVGNDDGGTLSAWLVLSALGIYPQVGTPRYFPSPPWFTRAEVDLNGGTLVVTAPGAPDAAEILSWTMNGQPGDGRTLLHADLSAGGSLHYELTPAP